MSIRLLAQESCRAIFAFAARSTSDLIGCFFGCGVLFCSPTIGILGGTCIGIVETFLTGCVLIGPVGVGLLSGTPRVDRAEGGPFEPPYWNNAY
jgi:hypothetical protein